MLIKIDIKTTPLAWTYVVRAEVDGDPVAKVIEGDAISYNDACLYAKARVAVLLHELGIVNLQFSVK